MVFPFAAAAAAARPLPWSGRILFGLVLIQLNAFLLHLGHLPPLPPAAELVVDQQNGNRNRQNQQNRQQNNAEQQPSPIAIPITITPMSQMSFTPDMTFNGECQSSKLWNNTWGRSVAPWVDKMDVKVLVQHMNTSVRTVPTIALYDRHNITNFTAETMARMPNAVLKPTQWTGYAAHILNDEYYCFKCLRKAKKRLRMDGDGEGQRQGGGEGQGQGKLNSTLTSNLHRAHTEAMQNMQYTLDNLPFNGLASRETQYKYLPRRIIVEEYLPLATTGMLEYHWWTVNGQPVFICVRCDEGGQTMGSYYSANFRELDMGGAVIKKCPAALPKPQTWDRMLAIVQKMGEHLPPGIVCIDLYANDTDVYFSEFTFTRQRCNTFFAPIVADALLYSMSHGLVTSNLVTGDYVEQTIADRSWVHVSLSLSLSSLEPDKETRLLRDEKQGGGLSLGSSSSSSSSSIIASTRSYPSSLDLCRNQTVDTVANCTRNTEPVAHFPLHCIVTTNHANANNEISATSIGQWKHRTVNLILARIDWRWALGIAALYFCLGRKRAADANEANGKEEAEEKEYGQVRNCFIYLALVVVYKSQQGHFSGLLAPAPLWNTLAQSYEIFTIVHPVTSPAIALSHFATYWISIAAFRARTLRAMLLYWLAYELVTAFVNEFFHYGEADDSVRCVRVAFIQHAKQYAINDVIRVYILPPFFVYGYLLPKMILHWWAVTVAFFL
jgi:hypothetical protein